MGSEPISPYTDNCMAKMLETEIQLMATEFNKDGNESMKLFKLFLDEIFTIFVGTTRDLHKLLDEINKIHPNMNLTMSHS